MAIYISYMNKKKIFIHEKKSLVNIQICIFKLVLQ